jgi:hypothetical protein
VALKLGGAKAGWRRGAYRSPVRCSKSVKEKTKALISKTKKIKTTSAEDKTGV